MDNVNIIIPCYWENEELIEITLNCINSIKDTCDAGVTIVNDGSPLDIGPENQAHFSQNIKVINIEKNGGFASAVNTGILHADAEIYVVANNDLEFIQPDWLEQLLQPLHEGANISLIRQTDTDGWETEDKHTNNDKFGALWAITKEAHQKLGPLDEHFGKGYFEDLDYWHRAQDLGMKIVKNHNGLVEHKGKQTFKVVDAKDELFGKNMFKYKEKWGDEAYLVEIKPNEIILIDKYEYLQKSKPEQKAIEALSVSLGEAKKRWSNV